MINFFAISKKADTFASTVPVLHPLRTAFGSFFKKVLITINNTPSMPLIDAHLEGFFILHPSNV